MEISHKPIRARIGVEVHGVDAEKGLTAAVAREILSLLDRYGVVVFPRLELDDPQQIAMARALGTIVPAYRGDPEHAPEYPELQTISLDPKVSRAAEYLKGSLFWHIDGTAQDIPPMASMLSARELPFPARRGGDSLLRQVSAGRDARRCRASIAARALAADGLVRSRGVATARGDPLRLGTNRPHSRASSLIPVPRGCELCAKADVERRWRSLPSVMLIAETRAGSRS